MNIKQAKYVNVSDLMSEASTLNKRLRFPWDSNNEGHITLATPTRFLDILSTTDGMTFKECEESLAVQAKVAVLMPTLESTEIILINLTS